MRTIVWRPTVQVNLWVRPSQLYLRLLNQSTKITGGWWELDLQSHRYLAWELSYGEPRPCVNQMYEGNQSVSWASPREQHRRDTQGGVARALVDICEVPTHHPGLFLLSKLTSCFSAWFGLDCLAPGLIADWLKTLSSRDRQWGWSWRKRNLQGRKLLSNSWELTQKYFLLL